MSNAFLKRSLLEILFDLKNPSNAIFGAFMFGPFISSDFKAICFCSPSNKITNLFGVEYDEFFLIEIYLSLNTLIKLVSRSSLKFFWRDEGISSLNNSKKNSDI